ncbi:COesterase-domain-containing protein [Gymnopus androsaceus JB14]|uniref:COesterase-domain-containing protein n=1 Tax=Gymnopus androsaceus JB14 TaxID=1447944 RepID=A0A6A4GHB9_9AGAR|nr:COesterase-domain-containing protein [Gymnopus androsaceus JB14]
MVMYLSQIIAVLATASAAAAASQPSVTIKNGTINGVNVPQFGQEMFLGIPYTQPPVGDLRLRVPQSINASFGTIDATAYGPHCWDSFTTGFVSRCSWSNFDNLSTGNGY